MLKEICLMDILEQKMNEREEIRKHIIDLLNEEKDAVFKYNFAIDRIAERISSINVWKEQERSTLEMETADQILQEDLARYEKEKQKAETEIKSVRNKMELYFSFLEQIGFWK